MTTHSLRKRATTALAVVASAGAIAGGLPPVSASATDDTTIPVLGQTVSRSTIDPKAPEAVITVHGVRRIQGGTAVYFSVGFPAGTANASALNLSLALTDQFRKYAASGRTSVRDDLGIVAAVDQRGKKVYSGLLASDQRCVCSHGSVQDHVKSNAAGTAFVMYVVLPQLPASVQNLDVIIGDKIIPAVPVQDQAMTPTVSADQPIALGTGWPAIDQSALATVSDPNASIYPLTQQITAGQLTTRTKTSTKSIDIAADVLFASGSATLTAAAQATLAKAGASLKSAGATGTVDVIGYTDSDLSEAFNLDLSKRRAAAVVAALKPLVGASITLVPQGKGEADPVASNDSPEGKALNRRVSLSFKQVGQ
ncbi:outer membrane protein OmpA-like peptidoglycan-associated protein [Branchiibius hedensis]|uniref:Outer membrane protein OmpA n=1 Tax=Branchiibius hedensis TaxID=672460 RepID=A0A2Y8ZY62_9MICO|nr:OmpA family protein [Branchiibius hedensis]PWJ26417.1 outer membrane protein OmpA-like peptidoglycan-associated protein [Branchiibius hedensis]SSA35229.1 Outer membrane protein OmpA [Branchiibius hedensis]